MNQVTEINDVEEVIERMKDDDMVFELGPYTVEYDGRRLDDKWREREYGSLTRNDMKNDDEVELRGDFFASLVEAYGATPAN